MGLKVVERYFELCKHLSFQSIIGEISTSVKQTEIRKGRGQFWISHHFFPKPMQCRDLITNNGSCMLKRNYW